MIEITNYQFSMIIVSFILLFVLMLYYFRLVSKNKRRQIEKEWELRTQLKILSLSDRDLDEFFEVINDQKGTIDDDYGLVKRKVENIIRSSLNSSRAIKKIVLLKDGNNKKFIEEILLKLLANTSNSCIASHYTFSENISDTEFRVAFNKLLSQLPTHKVIAIAIDIVDILRDDIKTFKLKKKLKN